MIDRALAHTGPTPSGWASLSTVHAVPASRRLALVVDTVDDLHIEHNPSGAQLTFSSPPNDPSYVSIPLREQ